MTEQTIDYDANLLNKESTEAYESQLAALKSQRLEIATQLLLGQDIYVERVTGRAINLSVKTCLAIADLLITENDNLPMQFWQEDPTVFPKMGERNIKNVPTVERRHPEE